MTLTDRLFGRRDPKPVWASFMTEREFREFIAMVAADIESRGVVPEVDAAAGAIRVTRSTGSRVVLGLSNVSQVWKRCWPGDRIAVVRDHFDRVLRTMSDIERDSSYAEKSFDEVRSLLKVRLYSSDTTGLERAVTRKLAEGITATLVCDMPETVRSVPKDEAARWNVSTDDLFRIATDNVKAAVPAEPEEFGLQSGASLTALMGDSYFVASHALYLDKFMPRPIPDMGALVAIPHRHIVLFHPVRNACCMEALQMLVTMAAGMHRDGPGSISPNVYWWRESAWWNDEPFMRIPAVLGEKRIEVTPPNEFVTKVLERVATKAAN